MKDKALSRSIGRNIRRWRRTRLMTVTDLAAKLRVSSVHVWRMEAGDNAFAIGLLARTCKVLHIGLSELVNRPDLF